MRVLRSALFVPGSSEKMMAKSLGYGADAVIYDLEDAVSPGQKDAARDLVARRLTDRGREARSPEIWVRINAVGDAAHLADVDAMLAARPDAILLPKAEAASLRLLEERLDAGESTTGHRTPVVALVETARGLLEAERMCVESRRLIGMQLGAEDLTKQLGVPRTSGGQEILLARSQLVIVGHAFGKLVLDTPNTAINDAEALTADVGTARALGMTGKTCIHPAQIPIVNRAFSPDEAEVARARRIVAAFDEAAEDHRGAFSLDGEMIDAPIAERARQLIRQADAIADRMHTNEAQNRNQNHG